ncbi:MAG: urea amidolyase [Sphingobium sp.]|nr:MAG: urea amidolyase [Sphingobium sp.]
MTTALLRVVSAGPGVTVQDGGRAGFLRNGVTGAGPMDPLAFATVNRALGSQPGTAAIEVSPGGVELSCEAGGVDVAVAGGAFDLMLDGVPLPSSCLAGMRAGSRLTVRAGRDGCWAYVGVAGIINVPPVLGSRATHVRSGLGGIGGRGLRPGDLLPVVQTRASGRPPHAIAAPWLARRPDVVRVVLGPQDDYFTAQELQRFLDGPWRVGRGDRMACLLEGPALAHARGFNIVSDGIAMGAIQVPGSGQPIVLLADRQPTGGYPKIATVIGADLGRLAQARPGTSLRFEAVPVDAAVAARREEAAMLAADIRLEPVVRTAFPPEWLMGVNLISGMVDALE